MKKLFTIFILFVGIFLQLSANNGSNCNQPLTAFEGINNSYYNGYYYQYYKYTTPFDGTITISTKGLTDNYVGFYVYAGSCNNSQIASKWGSNGIEFSVDCYNGDSIVIETYGGTSNGTMPWSLSISPKTLPIIPGKSCSNAVRAVMGANNQISVNENYRRGQWFKYTPPKKGHLLLSSAFNDEDYVQVYTQCGGTNLFSTWVYNYSPTDSSSYSFNVSDTATYYFLVSSNTVNNNPQDTGKWNLNFSPLGSAANIKGIYFYNDSSYQYGLNNVIIDTVTHTINAYAPKSANLSKYNYLLFTISPFASISKNGSSLGYGWSVPNVSSYCYYYGGYFKNTTMVFKVVSEDNSDTVNWSVSVVNSPDLSTGNKFLSFILNNNDTASIDTISHTIKAVYNNNLTSVYTKFTVSKNAIVKYNGSTFYSGNNYNYSDTVTLTVISESGNSQDWKVIVKQKNGSSCSNALVTTGGKNYGQGDYSQYFTYTAIKSGNVVFTKPWGNEFLLYAYSGSCGSMSYITGSWIYSNSPMSINVDSGKTYIFRTYDLYSDSFIFKTNVKGIGCNSSVTIKSGTNCGNSFNNQYFSYTATQTGNVVFSKPQGNYFYMYIDTGSCGSLNQIAGASVNSSSPYTLHVDSGKTYTFNIYYLYSDSFIFRLGSQIKGMDCGNAAIATLGTNYGNGFYNQYFTYTSAKKGNIIFSKASSNNFLLYVDTGSCGSLHQITGRWIYNTSPFYFNADSGKKYTFYTYQLYSDSFNISYPIDCSKPSLAVDGINTGNGAWDQYFTYTATKSANVTFSTSTSPEFHMEIDSGICGSNIYKADNWIYSSSSLTVPVISGYTYTIHAQYLYSNTFTISYPVSSCESPTTAYEGTNYGNGLYQQYFVYTPSNSTFVSISSDNYLNTEIGSGNCGSLDSITSASGYNPIGFKANAGKKYTLNFEDLYSNTFEITTTSVVRKAITNFQVYGGDSWYYASIGSGIDTVNHTINITTSPSSTLTNQYYYLSLLDQDMGLTTLKIGDSVVSPNGYLNFSSPIKLTILGIDGVKVNYTINITKRTLNSGTDFLTFYLPTQTGNAVIDPDAHTIKIGVTNVTDITSLSPYFTLSYKAKATDIFGNPQASGSTSHNFTDTVAYFVTAEDSLVAEWKVVVLKGDTAKNNLANFNTYHFGVVNETSLIDFDNKTITMSLPNGTDISSLTSYYSVSTGAKTYIGITPQKSGTSINNFTSPVTYTVMAQDSSKKDWIVSVKLVKNIATDVLSYAIEGQILSSINADAKTVNVIVPYGTDMTKLKASFTLSFGAMGYVNGTLQNNSSFNDYSKMLVFSVMAEDSLHTQDWSINVTQAENSATSITAFNLPGQLWSKINSATHSVDIKLLYGSDVTSLTATFALSTGAKAKIGAVSQVSGITKNNFTSSVIYTIIAQNDTSVQNWTITATVSATKNTETAITGYSIAGQSSSTIDTVNHTINVILPTGTDLTTLVATFALSGGATAMIGAVPQVSGTTINDFTNNLTYTVTAQDGTTTKNWTVIVSTMSNATLITSFSLPGQTSSTINSDNRVIKIVVPYGFDASNLIASFSLSKGATAKIGSINQISGTTSNNFVLPVTYTVSAEDGVTSSSWTILLEIGKNTATVITAFSISGQVSSNIDAKAQAINIVMPAGSSVSNLVATFTLSQGAIANINGTYQNSGTSSNNFSSPVTYVITAEDGTTTQNWTVTVTVNTSIVFMERSGMGAYPNPNNGSFNILSNSDINEAIVVLTDIDGKKVLLNKLKLEKGVPQLINLNVPAGVYILKISDVQNTYQQKMIVK